MESHQVSQEEFKKWVFDLTPRDFEKFIAAIYSDLGWESKVTGGSKDRGIDIKLVKSEDEHRFILDPDVLVQVKRHNSSMVGLRVIQRLAGEAIWQKPEAIVIVTTKGFTESARRTKGLIEKNAEFEIELLDYRDLYNLINENDIFHLMESF